MTRWLSLLLVAALGWFVPVEARAIPRAQPPVTTGYAQLLEEMSPASGNPKQFYVYGLNLTCQERNTGTPAAPNYELRYHAYDGLGNVRYLVQPDATVDAADTYSYDAFGVLISPASALANNQYLFAGEQWDDDLKLYYLRARYYDPNLGRFLTSDTFEGNQADPLSLHKYAYASADPVNRIDPSGNTDYVQTLVTVGIGGVIGGLSAGAVAEAQGRAVTVKEVLWGVGIGATLGYAAPLYAPLAVGAGIGGFVYSGISFGPILFDRNATPAQKRASAVLIATSMYGAAAGMKMGRVTTSEINNAPTDPPAGDYVILEHGTTLRRALSIIARGPDETFMEPGAEHIPRAGGISFLAAVIIPQGLVLQQLTLSVRLMPTEKVVLQLCELLFQGASQIKPFGPGLSIVSRRARGWRNLKRRGTRMFTNGLPRLRNEQF